jgi:hypothetical protein
MADWRPLVLFVQQNQQWYSFESFFFEQREELAAEGRYLRRVRHIDDEDCAIGTVKVFFPVVVEIGGDSEVPNVEAQSRCDWVHRSVVLVVGVAGVRFARETFDHAVFA